MSLAVPALSSLAVLASSQEPVPVQFFQLSESEEPRRPSRLSGLEELPRSSPPSGPGALALVLPLPATAPLGLASQPLAIEPLAPALRLLGVASVAREQLSRLSEFAPPPGAFPPFP